MSKEYFVVAGVKPLEWVKVDDTYYYAKGEDIKITSNGKGWGSSPRDFPHFGDFPYQTLESAMAAEQEEYKKRILDKLVIIG